MRPARLSRQPTPVVVSAICFCPSMHPSCTCWRVNTEGAQQHSNATHVGKSANIPVLSLSLCVCDICPCLQVEAWNRVLVAGAGAAAGSSGLTKEGFLTRWRVITLEDPRTAFEQVSNISIFNFLCCTFVFHLSHQYQVIVVLGYSFTFITR